MTATLEQLIQQQIADDEGSWANQERVIAEQREAHRQAALQSFQLGIDKWITEELREVLNASIVDVSKADDTWPCEFEYRFSVDGEEWAIGSVYDYIYAPDCPERSYDARNAYRLEGQPHWDDSILRAIRAYRLRKEAPAKEETQPKDELPAKPEPEPTAGPFLVLHSIYASKLQDALNKLDADSYFLLETHYRPGDQGYNGAFTIIAEETAEKTQSRKTSAFERKVFEASGKGAKS